MLYRPHFCCHCGEKIIRAKWTPLTSRRFCEFCAVEQKQHDLIPRAAAILLLLFGAAGFASYLGAGHSSESKPRQLKVAQLNSERSEKRQEAGPINAGNVDRSTAAGINSRALSENSSPANTEQRGTRPNSSTEAVYYCGATTKKGTPCTRRVKAPGRCWQHPGQPGSSSPIK
jgi:hypothetical protein